MEGGFGGGSCCTCSFWHDLGPRTHLSGGDLPGLKEFRLSQNEIQARRLLLQGGLGSGGGSGVGLGPLPRGLEWGGRLKLHAKLLDPTPQ